MAKGPTSAGNAGGNLPPLSLHVPEPNFRPGDPVDYSFLEIPPAGELPRPDETCQAAETAPLCTGMVRVLGDDHRAVGPWDPRLDPETLRRMLRV
ncbi:MAG: 3-methyl-2-oxobutanoate dehydrogenase (2-methylpropanoyl-transferring) subunit alpha, partial [Novosphingobium sp.]